MVVFEFELREKKASEGGVAALAVVEDLDEVEDLGSGVPVAGEPAAVDQFEFEGAPEAFHGGVAVAVAPAAHGGDQAGRLQGCPAIPPTPLPATGELWLSSRGRVIVVLR